MTRSTASQVALIVVAIMVFACAHQSSVPPCTTNNALDTLSPTTSVELAKQVASEVFALRCIQQKVPLQLQLLPEERFQDARRAVEPTDITDSIWPSHRLSAAGIYVPETRTISIIEQSLDDEPAALRTGFVLAHEIEHAVQHQYLSAAPVTGLDFDAALARKAVLEGEASFVAAAYLIKITIHKTYPRISMAQVLEWLAKREAGGVMAATLRGDAGDLERSLNETEIQSAQFSYGDGLTFIASLYVQGGFGAVDRVVARPPTSTEQVLHPAKYFADEKPIAVRVPSAVAAGSKVTMSRTLGELGIRLVMLQCMDTLQANATAVDWGGDRLTLLERQGTQHHVLWSTVWDSTVAATRFATALRLAPICICNSLAAGSGTFAVATRARGVRVALVCAPSESGADPDAAAAMLVSE